MARLFISAAHKSSGKTTVTLGLCAALAARGLAVQPFKKGPDYIDPMWHGLAAGRICRNLDFYTQGAEGIPGFYHRHAAGADVALIEGNKGLYDGVDPEGRDSGAALAKLLQAPVVLVIDAGGITRGVAPLLVGYAAFDPAVSIAGVILNKVAGSRHESKLREAVERYTDLPVLGAVHRSADLAITERHLGLVPANEEAEAQAVVARIRDAVAAQVDLDRVLEVARRGAAGSGPLPTLPPADGGGRAGGGAGAPSFRTRPSAGRIAYARDAAFGFYYPEDLETLAAEGFEMVPFDALRDAALPPALDGLFIGGGFPEMHMEALEANASMRASVRAAVEGGLPTYAECGGLMYLSRSIARDGRRHAMVGVLPLDTVMHKRPQGRGYVRLRETACFPWPAAGGDGTLVGHEFHHAGVANLAPGCRFAYAVERGYGIDGERDGIVVHNALAAFSHLRGVGANAWPRRFAAFIRSRGARAPAIRTPDARTPDARAA
ncbi:cobyrinate a,c-diamide synthase [Azospirillum halopraeferens]|uniref:cobyrinate a,c-diamide synthase n=1 Tax=Azospirillum halopraeferens TaxID=34010 RepID=UPI00040BCE22|nr:cobyrinate a,c-diamide synthase [Azospirillum halopraeferens]